MGRLDTTEPPNRHRSRADTCPPTLRGCRSRCNVYHVLEAKSIADLIQRLGGRVIAIRGHQNVAEALQWDPVLNESSFRSLRRA